MCGYWFRIDALAGRDDIADIEAIGADLLDPDVSMGSDGGAGTRRFDTGCAISRSESETSSLPPSPCLEG
jgi:hypothetical protein